MMKNENIIELINDTYEELKKIKIDIEFSKYSDRVVTDNILVIEITLSLFQLGFFNNRTIEDCEKYWFEGGFYIHYNLDGKWERLADNYSRIVRIVAEQNFFKQI